MIAAGAERTLSHDAFRALCEEMGGVADTDLFLETLHNAGVVFHRSGYFAHAIILDQQWAITAIYAAFDRDSRALGVIEGMGGRFTRTLLGAMVWDVAYSSEEQELFVAMMRSCGVCFELQPAADAAEAVYVAPDLLPTARSAVWPGEKADAAQERRYRHLPDALVRNIVAAVGAAAGAQGDYWRRGVRIYEARRRSEGLVEGEIDADGAGRILIRTRDGEAGELLGWLADLVERQEARLGLRPIQVVGTPNAAGCAHRPDAGMRAERPAEAVFAQRPEDRAGGDWFFSYANDSEKAAGYPVAAFCARMKVERRITIRRDVAELRYGDPMDQRERELGLPRQGLVRRRLLRRHERGLLGDLLAQQRQEIAREARLDIGRAFHPRLSHRDRLVEANREPRPASAGLDAAGGAQRQRERRLHDAASRWHTNNAGR